ncbi:MAG: HdeD family acid-resistance protein [Parachlamydiaceae bacterium]|nr:HdeD family acid-resistance protein [Parachlamydiaceae bacterium]
MDNKLTTRFRDIDEVRQNWGWFFALGILLVLLGCAVISSSFYATIFSVFILGIFLLGAGIVQIVQAFLARKWSGLFLSLMLGILYIVVGTFCAARPAIAAVSLTLWIAAFCFVAGLFRMLTSLILRFDQWEWMFFSGLITFILGAMIYAEWPLSGLWVIGLFVGIDMLLCGWSWILLSLTARK